MRLLKDFDDFSVNALPDANVEEYREYMRRSMAFIEARNRRIAAYATRLTRPAGEPRRLRVRGTAPTDDSPLARGWPCRISRQLRVARRTLMSGADRLVPNSARKTF